MYKSLHIGESWYVYRLSPPPASPVQVAGPYTTRQAANRTKHRLERKAMASIEK